MTLMDNAVYVAGRRTASPSSLDETYALLRERQGMAWIGLYRPDLDELQSMAREFELHHLAVDDAIAAHQRPKLERYGNTLFVVLRPARYLDDVEKVEFGELHVFVGPEFVVTVRHAESPDLALVRHRLEQTPELLRLGPEAVLYAILDQVVDEYTPVVAGLENDERHAGRPHSAQHRRHLQQYAAANAQLQRRARQPVVPARVDRAAGRELEHARLLLLDEA